MEESIAAMYKNKAKDGRRNICGAQIRRMRLELPEKTSQRELAVMVRAYGLDLDKNAVQRIESGERFVTDLELRAFAAVFGVTTDVLLGLTEIASAVSEEKKETGG